MVVTTSSMLQSITSTETSGMLWLLSEVPRTAVRLMFTHDLFCGIKCPKTSFEILRGRSRKLLPTLKPRGSPNRLAKIAFHVDTYDSNRFQEFQTVCEYGGGILQDPRKGRDDLASSRRFNLAILPGGFLRPLFHSCRAGTGTLGVSDNECLMNDVLYAVRRYDDYPRFMCIRVLSLCQYGGSSCWNKGDDTWL